MGFDFDWGWHFNWLFITAPIGQYAWLILLLNFLAVFRLSRVIARDSLTDGFRNRMTTKYHGPLVNLMLCMWCLSFWIGIVAVFLTAWTTTRDLWLVCCYVLAASAVGGYLGERS